MKRSPIARKTSLRGSVGPVRASKVAGKGRSRDTGPADGTRALVLLRAGGCCERCGMVPRGALHVHHRRPRAMGGSRDSATNSACNLLALCPTCHLGWVEQHREAALILGYLLRQGQDPASEPVELREGWVWLLPDGTKQRA